MKGINISCSSRASTAIYTPISMDQPSSSSSSSPFPVTLLGGSTGGGGGSRLIDRHNPIIADERRISKPTPPSSSHSTPYFTPKSSPFIHQKKTPKTNSKAKKKTSVNSSTSNAKRLIGLTPKIKTNSDHDPHRQIRALKQGASQPSELIIIKDASKAAAVDHISPPESSRYLLDDPAQEFGSGFLDRVLSDFDPVLKLKVPFDQPEISPTSAHYDEIVAAAPKSLDGCSKTSKKPPLPSSVPSSDNQVVVLRVSLHCRGCEGKVRKHISRMQGVRSFNIDFAAKKVTVEGDVTPLEVLTSISKVKNAQIWTPPASAASKSMDPITQKI